MLLTIEDVRSLAPGTPYWCVMWKSGSNRWSSGAPAFWYYDSREEARSRAVSLLDDGATVSLTEAKRSAPPKARR